MTEKRPFADFSRFSFVESSGLAETGLTGLDTASSHESKRAKILPLVPLHKLPKEPDAGKERAQIVTGGLSELYKSVDCVERPLWLLIVGHNPSDQSWSKGHYYANPNNRMWFLLSKAGIVPTGFKADCDRRCPYELGLGFTDVMSGIPDTQSCNITDSTLKSHKGTFFKRLEAHTQRAAAACHLPVEEAYPRIIAFAGVRQWKALFPTGHFDDTAAVKKEKKAVEKNQPLLTNMFSAFKPSAVVEDAGDVEKVSFEVSGELIAAEGSAASRAARQSSIPYGVQTQRPDGWPVSLRQSVVFLLPSSSGAAALSNADREGPYLELGQLLQQERYRWLPGVGLAEMQQLVNSSGIISRAEDPIEKGEEVVSVKAEQKCIDLSESPVAIAGTTSIVKMSYPIIDLSE